MATLHVGFAERRFPRRRSGRWFSLLFAAIPLLLVTSVLAFGMGGISVLVLAFLAAVGARLLQRDKAAKTGPTPISFDRKFLSLPTEFVAFDRIRSAFVDAGPGEERAVVLDLVDGSSVVLGVTGLDAERLLEELPLRPDQRLPRVPLAPSIGALRLLLFLLGVAFAVITLGESSRHPVADLVLVAVLAGPLLALLLPGLLRAGAPSLVAARDGLRIEEGDSTRFVPYAEIASLEAEGPTLVIRRREKGPVRLSMRDASDAHVRGVRHRIEAMAARRDGEPIARVLARGDRPLAEWRASLAALTERGTDFRQPSYGAEDLARVLDDAAATPEVRVGAAVALRASDPEGTARIRIAASETADDELRAALEAIADDEPADAVMERAIRTRD